MSKPVDDNSAYSYSGGPYTISTGTTMQLLQDAGVLWGIRIQTDEEEAYETLQFRTYQPEGRKEDLQKRDYELHCILGGDIRFINLVTGLQTCSATYPCYRCLVCQNIFKARTTQGHNAALRDQATHARHLSNVLQHDAISQRKNAAKTNGSTIRKALIPVHFSRIELAVLHIVIGIVKKMWDELIKELQGVEEGTKHHIVLRELRERLLIHEARLQEEENVAIMEASKAETKRQEAFERLKVEREENKRSKTISKNIAGLRFHHQDIARICKEKKESLKNIDKKRRLAIASLVEDINCHLQTHRGPLEHALETVIGQSPISAKHNPFYGGSFNGNDCFRIIENYSLLFVALRGAVDANDNMETQQNVKGIAERHEKVFGSFAAVLPLFRKTGLLSDTEQQKLIVNIEKFWEAYIKHSNGSVTLKIHQMVSHTQEWLKIYGTVGLFTEDSVESIHAIVNALARRYASLDKERKATQIMRAIESRKMMSNAEEEKSTKKRKRRQGRTDGTAPEEAVANVAQAALTESIVGAATLFLDQWSQNENDTGLEETETEDYFPPFELKNCSCCRDFADEDNFLPDLLLPLHTALCHTAIGAKFSSKKGSEK